jgi:hypothetical protein
MSLINNEIHKYASMKEVCAQLEASSRSGEFVGSIGAVCILDFKRSDHVTKELASPRGIAKKRPDVWEALVAMIQSHQHPTNEQKPDTAVFATFPANMHPSSVVTALSMKKNFARNHGNK